MKEEEKDPALTDEEYRELMQKEEDAFRTPIQETGEGKEGKRIPSSAGQRKAARMNRT